MVYAISSDKASPAKLNINGGEINAPASAIAFYLLEYSETNVTNGNITTGGVGMFLSSYDYKLDNEPVKLTWGGGI